MKEEKFNEMSSVEIEEYRNLLDRLSLSITNQNANTCRTNLCKVYAKEAKKQEKENSK